MRPRSARLQLAAVPHASREARNAAKQRLLDWGLPGAVVDDAMVVISELVTNAVRHAGTASVLDLEVGQSGAVLRICLTDESHVRPRPRRASPTSEDGRGMMILAALSDRWGIEPHHRGKRVWWEVDLDPGYRSDDTASRANASASA